MLRIGEFAELSSISIHMLRNYDKIGLLIPDHIDQSSGYRYYDKKQLVQANQLIALKNMGFGLDEIKKIMMRRQTDVNDFLREKLKSKYMELERTKKQIGQIKAVLNAKENAEDYTLKIVRKQMRSMWVASLSGQIDTYPQEGIMWEKLNAACKKNHITVLQEAAAIAIYKGTDEKTGRMQIEVRFPLDREYKAAEPLKVFQTEECEVASIVFGGNYSQIYEINTAVAGWLENNKLEISGRVFTIYHKSPGNCAEESAFITELCFPVKEK